MLSNLPISRKLCAGFALVIAAMVVMSGISAWNLNELWNVSHVNSDSSDAQDKMDKVAGDISETGREILIFAVTGDKAKIDSVRDAKIV